LNNLVNKSKLVNMIRFIPNILTFGRLVLAFVFLVMILYSPTVENKSSFLDVAFVLFVVTGLTDIVDGKIARKYNVTSKLGRIMDPLADKVLVCGAFLCFAVIGEPILFPNHISPAIMAYIQWSILAIITAREVYVTILRQVAESKGINFAATTSGKAKMFAQSFAIGTVIVKIAHASQAAWAYWFTSATFIIMLTLTIVSGLQATKRGSFNKNSENISELNCQ